MYPQVPFPTPRDVIFFMLVLSRVAGIFAALPVFGGRRLPLRIKAVTVFMITLVCFPTLAITVPQTPTDVFSLALLALSEIMIGLTLAFITQIIFAAVAEGRMAATGNDFAALVGHPPKSLDCLIHEHFAPRSKA
jgi:flagellar biosynthetic protein FliR